MCYITLLLYPDAINDDYCLCKTPGHNENHITTGCLMATTISIESNGVGERGEGGRGGRESPFDLAIKILDFG